jgi:hypothetical protein
VDGNVTDTVDGKVTIRAEDLFGGSMSEGLLQADKINIVVGGKLLLSLEKSGKLQFFGKTLTVDGQAIKLKGGKIKKVGAGGDAQGKAAAASLAKQEGVERIEVEVVDALGNPAPQEPVRIERDGAQKDLRADSDGRLLVLVPTGKTAKAGFPRLDDEKDGGGKATKGEEKKVAGAVEAEAGKPVELKAGKKNVVQLPVRRDVMTIAFLWDGPSLEGQDYPRYVLESDDGAYRVEKSPRDDLVKGDQYLQLRFAGLTAGRTYALTRWADAQTSERLFAGAPGSQLVDQPRGWRGGGGEEPREAELVPAGTKETE